MTSKQRCVTNVVIVQTLRDQVDYDDKGNPVTLCSVYAQLGQLLDQVQTSKENNSGEKVDAKEAIKMALALLAASAVAYYGMKYIKVSAHALSDVWFVTRGTFRLAHQKLHELIGLVDKRLTEVKNKLQTHMLHMLKKLDATHEDIVDIKNKLEEMESRFNKIDMSLDDIGLDQKQCLYGVSLLVEVVGDITSSSQLPSCRKLIAFTQSPSWDKVKQLKGLEGLLDNDEAFDMLHRRYTFGERDRVMEDDVVKPVTPP